MMKLRIDLAIAYNDLSRAVTDINNQFQWIESLLWCPSQCYYYFQHYENRYCIYLRWRHRDPWTAELMSCNEEWALIKSIEYIKLNKEYTQYDYEQLEEDVLAIMSKKFPDINFHYK